MEASTYNKIFSKYSSLLKILKDNDIALRANRVIIKNNSFEFPIMQTNFRPKKTQDTNKLVLLRRQNNVKRTILHLIDTKKINLKIVN